MILHVHALITVFFAMSVLMSRRNSVFRRSVDILTKVEGYGIENATEVVNRALIDGVQRWGRMGNS